ncbi:MAG: DNA-3-methyladenine glycosylase family protein [Halobacteriales archaeon]
MESDPYTLLKQDPVIAQLIDNHQPIELIPHPDPFERLIISVINQQLSIASARAIRDRLFERFEITPTSILNSNKDDLKSTGLSAQKVDYIFNIALAFKEGLSAEKLHSMTDEEVIEILTEIRGVGVWTAKMFLIFVLAREDIFPIEDLGIRKAMQKLYPSLDTLPKMIEKAEDWRPYRSYASRYLWTAVD